MHGGAGASTRELSSAFFVEVCLPSCVTVVHDCGAHDLSCHSIFAVFWAQ